MTWIIRDGKPVGRPAKPDCPLEHEEQHEFVKWFRRTFAGVRIFAIPNGGKRGKKEAMRFKAEGVTKGVPDMYVPAWKLWVEMKRQFGGVIDEDQEDWADYLVSIGDTHYFTMGCEDAKKKVLNFIETNGLIK